MSRLGVRGVTIGGGTIDFFLAASCGLAGWLAMDAHVSFLGAPLLLPTPLEGPAAEAAALEAAEAPPDVAEAPLSVLIAGEGCCCC